MRGVINSGMLFLCLLLYPSTVRMGGGGGQNVFLLPKFTLVVSKLFLTAVCTPFRELSLAMLCLTLGRLLAAALSKTNGVLTGLGEIPKVR